MKMVKSKYILVVSVLSMFLVQIINSGYIPVAKPIEKPEAAPESTKALIPKTPIAKPAIKPALKAAPPIEIIVPSLLADISLGEVQYHSTDSNHSFIDALNSGEIFTGEIYEKGILTLQGSKILVNCEFLTDPGIIYYKCVDGTDKSFEVNINKGTSITIQVKDVIPTKTVTITVLAGTISFGDITILGATLTNINNDFSKFNNDLLINGLTVTGVVTDQGIRWKYSGGTFSSSANSKPTGLAVYANPKNPAVVPNFMFNVGDTINIIGTKAPSVTITIPANLQDISLGSNNTFTGHHELLEALNNGETFTGAVVSDGTKNSVNTLTLTTKTSSTTATGTFWTKNQINYFCTGDKEYTYSAILNPGTIVTITGTKTPPPVTIMIPSTVSEILLGGITNSSFDNATALLDVINKGETVVGTINSSNALTFASATTAKIATGTFVTKPNQISYRCVGDAGYTNIPVNPGTFVTITLNKVSNFTINPFLTLDMVEVPFRFFYKFDNIYAISSNSKTVSAENDLFFCDSLFSIANNAYEYIGDNKYSPLFDLDTSRCIYGQFSDNGATLRFYKDQAHTNGIGTFALQSPQAGEYISQLFWHTDAYIPTNPTKDPRVGSDGHISGIVQFDKIIAQSNGSIMIKLINPNDETYKILSGITDFTGLTFYDIYANNVALTNNVVVDKVTTDTLNRAISNDLKSNSDLILQAMYNPALYFDKNWDYFVHYSNEYNPRIMIYSQSEKFIFDMNYNYMYIQLEETGSSTARCKINYQEKSGAYNHSYDTNNFNAIAKISTKKIPALTLQAPVVTDQIFFYLDIGYNPEGGPFVHSLVNNNGARIYVDCNCMDSKSCVIS